MAAPDLYLEAAAPGSFSVHKGEVEAFRGGVEAEQHELSLGARPGMRQGSSSRGRSSGPPLRRAMGPKAWPGEVPPLVHNLGIDHIVILLLFF